MKALTLWQPWASLVIEGAKPYEFRGWRPPSWLIGQRIVIHAATKKIDRDALNHMLMILALRDRSDDISRAAAETCLHPEIAIPVLNRALDGALPTASGIGTAVVGEPRLGPDIAQDFGVSLANDSDRDQHANWGWPMLEIERWDAPIPMRGMQGLWTWPTPEGVGL